MTFPLDTYVWPVPCTHVCDLPSVHMYVIFPVYTCYFPSVHMYVIFPVYTCGDLLSVHMYVTFPMYTCMWISQCAHVCDLPSVHMYVTCPVYTCLWSPQCAHVCDLLPVEIPSPVQLHRGIHCMVSAPFYLISKTPEWLLFVHTFNLPHQQHKRVAWLHLVHTPIPHPLSTNCQPTTVHSIGLGRSCLRGWISCACGGRRCMWGGSGG